MSQQGVTRRRLWIAAVTMVAAGLASLAGALSQPAQVPPNRPEMSQVFTPARSTVGQAVRDFFGVRPDAVQPIAFPHSVHIANRLGCLDYCHASAAAGPVAGLPSVRTCLICHRTVATDRPEVQKVVAYEERGEDIAWQRVYGYPPSAHVKFNHAPHVRRDVKCGVCHGDVAQQREAQRSKRLTMGFCVGCHRANQAPTDCTACHF